jgi:hypothetical protein
MSIRRRPRGSGAAGLVVELGYLLIADSHAKLAKPALA